MFTLLKRAVVATLAVMAVPLYCFACFLLDVRDRLVPTTSVGEWPRRSHLPTPRDAEVGEW